MRIQKIIRRVWFLMLFSLPAWSASGWMMLAHTGVTSPMQPEDFNQSFRGGFNAGLGIGRLIAPRLEIQARFAVNEAPFDQGGFRHEPLYPDPSGFNSVDGKSTYILTMLADARLSFPPRPGGKINSYFFAGAGIMRISKKHIVLSVPSQDQDILISSQARIDPAVDFGLGIELALENRANFFAEAGYVLGLGQNGSPGILPIRFGVCIR
ncbi:hypothetical protein JW906_05010 [bacterium]|nr:hypothetical protein [bacterium]